MKFLVAIRSKPGLSEKFESLIAVEAIDEAQAAQIARIKAKNSKKRFRYRTDSMWIIDSVTKVENDAS